ncbi:ribonuclease H-like domain, reverse transcriptase, RNA-dependent DNA polymerase, partial [Tanacetum coccineum]
MSTRRLELVHGDLCGPISPLTPAGNRYFLLLVDDYTRVMWVYFLKTKDQALSMFKKFRVEVEAETEKDPWQWGKSEKFKGTPGATLTIEGFIPQDDREDDNMESQTGLEFPAQGTDEHYETNSEDESVTPISSDGSAGSISSLTGGGAPKRCRTLTELYDETNEVLNNTWTLVELPPGRKAIGLKWVYKVKKDPTGAVIKHKARLVAKGHVQEAEIDFDEVYAPVARIETVRILLALSSKNGWFIHHLDVKSAFLNGELQDEVYVVQPEGYEKKDQPGKVYKLSKALYGLRQASRAWNSRLDSCLKQLGFKRCQQEYAVYTRNKAGKLLIVGFTQYEDCITLKQAAYVKTILKKTVEKISSSDIRIAILQEMLMIEEVLEVWPFILTIIGNMGFAKAALCSSLFMRSGVHGIDLSSNLDQTFVKRDNGKRDKATGAVH